MLEFISKFLKTEVTCVKCFKNNILAGIGNNLHVFSTKGELLQIYPVFQGQEIHGIIPNTTNKIAVFGANAIKIIEFDFFKCAISRALTTEYCKDWIFDLRWLDSDTQIAVIFAKNFVSLWSFIKTNIKYVTSIECEERCTLYSATLVNNNWNNLFVLSGTVFGQILIWKPADVVPFSPVLYRLEGHDGAIFSIAYSKLSNIITTTSDDRTVRIWTLNNNFFMGEDESVEIALKHTMYGHIARVFRCKITENYIVTAGEDSFVHIWNFNGELVRKFETHQGGCIWALDYCSEEDIIVTGGSDCGISVYPLEVTKEIEILPVIEGETPKSFKLTASNNIIIMMDSGWLKYFIVSENRWIDVHLLEDLKSYAILQVSKNRELIALAGLKGSIHVYKEFGYELKKCCDISENNNSRIFSLCWLNNNEFLTSINDGVMNFWSLELVEDEYKAEKKHTFILPPCKERWATCAAICFKYSLAVGDRKGNIHLYGLENGNYIQTVKKAHCHLGITSLHYLNNHLYSLGRNGILNKYSMNSLNQLSQVANDKLSFSWLASMVEQNGTNLIIGFTGSNFVIYNLDQRRIIFNFNCGGGHRSWDISITKENLFYLYFLKEKNINKFSDKLVNILTRDFISGYHTNEINCTDIIKIKEGSFLFISGGEDTTLRFSVSDFQSNLPKFVTINTLKSHLSSIRCIFLYPLENNSYLLFSGGGRAQITLYKLEINSTENEFDVICQQKDSYYKKLDDFEAETRIMDFVAINLNKIILLIAGTSDGTLKCYSVDLKENLKLRPVGEVVYAAKCIMKLSYIKIFDRCVVISVATDGNLVFWDFTEYCNQFEDDLKPFYVLKANQSGINSICIKSLRNETYLFATGGDDNSVVLNVIEFVIIDNLLKLNLVCNWHNSLIHGAQVTGILVYNNYFITTSVDQYICVFQYVFSNNILKCQFQSQYCTTVADIKGMRSISFQNEIYICLYGKGIEVLRGIINSS